MSDKEFMVSSADEPLEMQTTLLAQVLENMCIINHLLYEPHDLVKTLARVMTYEIDLALDPRVSSRAHALTVHLPDHTGQFLRGPEKHVAPELLPLVERYFRMLEPSGATPHQCEYDQHQPMHYLWMLHQIRDNDTQSRTKKHRWIGWLQAELIRSGFMTVEEEREFTRPILNGL